MKKYISVAMFADKYGVAERTVRNYCAKGKIGGAYLMGKTWNIPADAALPVKHKHKEQVMSLLVVLQEQKQMRLKGSIYHSTQIDLTYNSNHIEGSRLTHDQTRYIFETNTIGVTDDGVKVDDIIETVNHFRCIDFIIEHAMDKLSEGFIKELHFILKSGTTDSNKDWFAVGDYKKRIYLTVKQTCKGIGMKSSTAIRTVCKRGKQKRFAYALSTVYRYIRLNSGLFDKRYDKSENIRNL